MFLRVSHRTISADSHRQTSANALNASPGGRDPGGACHCPMSSLCNVGAPIELVNAFRFLCRLQRVDPGHISKLRWNIRKRARSTIRQAPTSPSRTFQQSWSKSFDSTIGAQSQHFATGLLSGEQVASNPRLKFLPASPLVFGTPSGCC